jgi:hypothetical protein
MPVCSRCNTNVHPFSFRSYLRETGRCNRCDAEVQQALIRFIDEFRKAASDGVLTAEEWRVLKAIPEEADFDLSEALAYTRPDVLELIRRTVALASADNVITGDEERQIEYLLTLLEVPTQFADDVRATLTELKAAQRARAGNLKTIQPSIHLNYGEICHMEVDAVYINTETKTYPRREGRLLATNKALHFASPQGGFSVDWKRVTTAIRDGDTIYLEMSIKRGNGLYVTAYPVFAEAVITYLVKASRSEAKNTSKVTTERPATKSPYEVLNVRRDATREEVVSAYREMCKLYHPDKVAHLALEFKEIAEARMREINAAYQQLTK